MYIAITSGTIPTNNINFSLNTRYYFIKVSDNTFKLALPTSKTTSILGISDMINLTLTQVTGPSFMLQNCKFRVGESFDVIVDEYYISKSTDMMLTATSSSGSGTGMKIKLANINRVLSSAIFSDNGEGCDYVSSRAELADSWEIFTNPKDYLEIY